TIDRLLDEAAAGKPDIDVKDEYGVTHQLWTITNPAVLSSIQELMAGRKLIIADGHHRDETALTYRDEMRAKTGMTNADSPYERMAMTFFNMDAPGLTILPTHRVLANIADFDSAELLRRAADFFDVREAPADP